MTNLKQIDVATLDDTSVENLEVLMTQYISNRTESEKISSKKLFHELVASLQQSKI